MFQRRRYISSDGFYSQNTTDFESVVQAKTKLLSLSQLGETGMALSTAEGLCFDFLNLRNKCADLLFGLSASVSDSKVRYKEIEGIQPKYFEIVCNILKISGEKGLPLDSYKKY